MQPLETNHFECQCGHFEHVVRFTLDPDDGDVFVDVHLNRWLPWWKRAWIALKYTLGLGEPSYADTILRVEDIARLQTLLDRSQLAHQHQLLKQMGLTNVPMADREGRPRKTSNGNDGGTNGI